MMTRERAIQLAKWDPEYVARQDKKGGWGVWDGWSDHWVEFDDENDGDACSDPGGHSWVYSGTAYGGDDESYFGEGRCYCEFCGADGDA